MKILAQRVFEVTAAHFGMTVEDLKSPRRTRPYARARQVAMYCTRRLCPHMSRPEIGRHLGGRDHTTVLHGERKIAELMAEGQLVDDVRDIMACFPVDDRLEGEIEVAEQLIRDTTARLAMLRSLRPQHMQVAA